MHISILSSGWVETTRTKTPISCWGVEKVKTFKINLARFIKFTQVVLLSNIIWNKQFIYIICIILSHPQDELRCWQLNYLIYSKIYYNQKSINVLQIPFFAWRFNKWDVKLTLLHPIEQFVNIYFVKHFTYSVTNVESLPDFEKYSLHL